MEKNIIFPLHLNLIVCIFVIIVHTIRKDVNMVKITAEIIQKIFEDKHIHSSEYLKKHFGCTFQCIWDNLRKVGYYSSFTHNSKYYTLADIPEFDDNDVWFYADPEVGEIGFTKKKTASNLIISLINSNETGMTEYEIREIMKIRVSNQLNVLVKKSKIRRLKIGNKCYYFSTDEKKYNGQYAKLTKDLAVATDIQLHTSSNEQTLKHKIKRLTTGRENWRKRANEKQKKIRELLIRIRDLKRSRDKWKSKAMDYKGKLLQLKNEIDHIKKNS